MGGLRKFHVHSEQFDGHLHAWCGAADVAPPEPKIVGYDELDNIPRADICAKCFHEAYPRGWRYEA